MFLQKGGLYSSLLIKYNVNNILYINTEENKHVRKETNCLICIRQTGFVVNDNKLTHHVPHNQFALISLKVLP